MRKLLLLLILSFCAGFAYSQKVVYMDREGGVYKIPCAVNGARMKMIFDTGASNVSLSKSMADYLIENEYISKKDILGTSSARIADGSVVKVQRVNLKDVEIGGMHIYNVEATISTSQYAPLLLGQSAIQKLGKISIDGNKLIINSMSPTNNSYHIQSLRNEIKKAEFEGKYSIVLEKLNRLKSIDNLTGNDYNWLCACYYYMKQYKECVLAAYEADQNGVVTDASEKVSILMFEGDSFRALEYFKEAEICLKQAMDYANSNDEFAGVNLRLGILYNNRQLYETALKYYFKARDYYYRRLGCSGKEVDKGYIQDNQLGFLFNEMRRTYNNKGDGANALDCLRLAAQCGHEECQRDCKRIGQRYHIRKKK